MIHSNESNQSKPMFCLSMRDIFRLRMRKKQILPVVSSKIEISYPTDTKP